MSRIRSIHPGLFKDEAFMSLSMAARVLLMGIWTECDDHGVFEWKPLTLKAALFPADALDVPTMTVLLEELVSNNCVQKTAEVGRTYGLVRNFCQWQRPKNPSYRYPFPERWSEYVAWKGGVSPSATPAKVETTDSTPEKPPQMEEGRGREEESKRGGEGNARERADPPSTGLKDLLGSRMTEDWGPNQSILEELGAIIPPASISPFIARFVQHYLDEETRSTDWNFKLLAAARAAKPAPKKAPPVVQIDKRDTRPPPGMIGQPAYALGAELCAAMAVPDGDPLLQDMPRSCQRWFNAGIDETIIRSSVLTHFSATKKLPDKASFYDRMLKRESSEVASGSVSADPTRPAGTINGPARAPRRTAPTPPSYADQRLAAIAREAEADGDRPQEQEADRPVEAGPGL